jgi:predicted TIM-barrel fold metal-dependent hydrolase
MVYRTGAEPSFLKSQPTTGWFIDGQIYPRRIRDDQATGTTTGTRELSDVAARLRHMDQLNVDVQVIYPTLLLHEFTRRPEVETALCESYNRWMADRTSHSNGRLRWVAVLPLRSMPEALVEMRRVKQAGATGVFKRTFECDERRAGDPYFHPVYRLAEELDLPICFHVSRPYTGNMGEWAPTQHGIHISGFMQDALLSILASGVPQLFPKLRFGFIEAGAGWVSYMLWTARRAAESNNRPTSWSRMSDREILAESRFFVTCEMSENLTAIIHDLGDDPLCIGTDYTHHDPHFDLSAFDELFARHDLGRSTVDKIAGTNAQALYGTT